jgi:hypothetical protein
MDKQVGLRPAIVAAAAVVLAAAIPLSMEAQAYPYGHRIGTGYQVATGADKGSTVDKADPTNDGSIIVECVGFNSRKMPYATEADTAPTLHAVSMPQYPLGPSKCWPGEQGAIGGGGGGLMTVF